VGLEKLKHLLRPLFFIAFGLVTLWTFEVPPAQGFQYPDLARIFFWHFPCSMLLLAFMFGGIYFSLRVFRNVDQRFTPLESTRERMQWDIRAESAMELGFIWSTLTMATGVLFSLVQWGSFWQWDPRQTSFLLALLIYGGYFALRNSFSDLEKRAHFSAAYALATALPIFFLVLIFPRLPQVEAVSFHPTNTIMQGQLHGQYGYVTICMLVLTTILSIWLYRMRSRAGLLSLALDYDNGQLEASIRRDTTPTNVVRPLNLSREDGPASEGGRKAHE
jgi:heme exporter protein C